MSTFNNQDAKCKQPVYVTPGPRLYIGSDPDTRILNAALLLSEPPASTDGLPPCLSAPRKLTPLAVFLRRNRSPYTGDRAVAAAVPVVSELVNDVVKYLQQNETLLTLHTVLIVEGQSIHHALATNKKGFRNDPQDIVHLAQIAGLMMGAFMAQTTFLKSPMQWKKGVQKDIHHNRIYTRLGWVAGGYMGKGKDRHPYPEESITETITAHSAESVNRGDWLDLNDSVGITVYGAEEGL
jgi:hypothetical protein